MTCVKQVVARQDRLGDGQAQVGCLGTAYRPGAVEIDLQKAFAKPMDNDVRNVFGFPEATHAAANGILVQSMRCWRAAMDIKVPVQPQLFALLARLDCVVLAPVLDSLFCFYEAALERALAIGQGQRISDDENLLLHLLCYPESCSIRLRCPNGPAKGLDCALHSTRIMLTIAQGQD